MAQIIQIKRSTTPGNVPGPLETGELAINVTDGSLFFGSATTVHNSFKFGGLDIKNDLTVVGEVYTDMIKRESSNATTTKIKSSANKWEIYAGHSSNEVMKIELGQVTIDGEIEMGANKITGLGDPTLAQDGATKAYVDSQTHTDGTVTSVAALTLGTTGTDLSSTVVDSTTAAVITLNVPTASASNRGALSSTDWTTFNDKGTVTSVSSTTGGDALDVAVSNASTTPAIALTWAGADTQYIDGEGNLITFPTIPAGDVTAVDGGTYITTTDSTGPVPVVNHDATDRTDTTSTVSPAHGDTFTAVDSVSTNATGHITALNLKTVTLPDDAEGVTSVSGTAPVSVTAGATPTVSMAVATTSASGYLTSTDWTTFNNKTSNTGTVTSVAVSGSDGIDVDSGSPITTNGTIALGLSNVPNTSLANSSVTITAGAGLTDGGSVALGASTELNIGEGVGIDVAAASISINLSELTTSTTDGDGDFFAVIDSSNAQKKLTKGNINNSGFNNDAGYTTNAGTVTSVGTTGSVNGITLTGGDITSSGTITLGGTLGSIANSQLTNSTVNFGGVNLSLGGADTSPAFNLADAHSYAGDTDFNTTGTITSGTWNSDRFFTLAEDACTKMGDYVIFGSDDATDCGLVYYYNNGAWALANAGAVSTSSGLLAIAMSNSVSRGMVLRGMFGAVPTDPGDDGDVLYLSETDGVLTNTAPTTSGTVVRVVGYALSDTPGLWFNPDNTWLELS